MMLQTIISNSGRTLAPVEVPPPIFRAIANHSLMATDKLTDALYLSLVFVGDTAHRL
jgi:hypothetical protein